MRYSLVILDLDGTLADSFPWFQRNLNDVADRFGFRRVAEGDVDMLRHAGTRDILNPDARLLAEKATAAGVDIDYHEQEGLLHVYPLMPTPEGRAARAAIAECLRG